MKTFRTAAMLLAICLIPAASSYGDAFSYTYTGEVGSNSSAVGAVTGTAWGDSAWSFNGSPITAGTELTFNYTVDESATDSNADTNIGAFGGGALTVSIPTLGVVDEASADSYILEFVDSDAAVVFTPSSLDGFGLVGIWDAGTTLFSDANVLATVPNTNVSELFGTSPNGNFVLNLANGDVLQTTSNTELLQNATFSSSGPSAVPEPSSLVVIGLASIAGCLHRRRRR